MDLEDEDLLPRALSQCEALSSENDNLRQCLEALRQIDDEAIIKLAKSESDLRRRLAQLVEASRCHEEDMLELKGDKATLQERLNLLQSEKAEAIGQVTSLRKQIDEVKTKHAEELRLTERRVNRATEDCERHRSRCREASQERGKAQAEVRHLTEQLDASKERVSSILSRASASEEELRSQLTELQQKLAASSKENAKIIEMRDHLMGSVATANADAMSLREELNQCKEATLRAEDERSLAQGKLDKLKNHIKEHNQLKKQRAAVPTAAVADAPFNTPAEGQQQQHNHQVHPHIHHQAGPHAEGGYHHHFPQGESGEALHALGDHPERPGPNPAAPMHAQHQDDTHNARRGRDPIRFTLIPSEGDLANISIPPVVDEPPHGVYIPPPSAAYDPSGPAGQQQTVHMPWRLPQRQENALDDGPGIMIPPPSSSAFHHQGHLSFGTVPHADIMGGPAPQHMQFGPLPIHPHQASLGDAPSLVAIPPPSWPSTWTGAPSIQPTQPTQGDSILIPAPVAEDATNGMMESTWQDHSQSYPPHNGRAPRAPRGGMPPSNGRSSASHYRDQDGGELPARVGRGQIYPPRYNEMDHQGSIPRNEAGDRGGSRDRGGFDDLGTQADRDRQPRDWRSPTPNYNQHGGQRFGNPLRWHQSDEIRMDGSGRDWSRRGDDRGRGRRESPPADRSVHRTDSQSGTVRERERYRSPLGFPSSPPPRPLIDYRDV